MSSKSSKFRGVTLFRPTMKWRAQISSNGKTTSLGDHDTEESAGRAFDRASINRKGRAAKTNFPIDQYEFELEELQTMSAAELVAMLRNKARKTGNQTSHYRGVSLLKQTNKWHAQINVGGRQIHLGFFDTEEAAARAYDRAAINKGAKEGGSGRIITNFDIDNYADELDMLRRIPQEALVAALSSEAKRKQASEMLSEGLAGRAEAVFGKTFPGAKQGNEGGSVALEALKAKAERAQPKSTARNPLYIEFGRRSQRATEQRARQQGDVDVARQQRSAEQRGRQAVERAGRSTALSQVGRASGLLEPLGIPPLGAAPSPSRKRSGQQAGSKRSLFRAQRPDMSPGRLQHISGIAPLTPGSSRQAAQPPVQSGASHPVFMPQLSHRQAQPAEGTEDGGAAQLAGPPTPTPGPRALPWEQARQARAEKVRAARSAKAVKGGGSSLLPSAASKEGRPEKRQEARLTHAEHRRAQAEQRALVADVINHVMARPLTKRQEALAARKKQEAEEAAATLSGGRQPTPLPEEVGEALMDFAAAAELAELEDRQQQAGRSTTPQRHSLAADGARSEDTRSTITFQGRHARYPGQEEEHISKRHRSLTTGVPTEY